MISEERKSEIRKNLSEIFDNIEKAKCDDRKVVLLAATKTRTPEEINFLAECGVTHIGENKVQELMDKYDAIDKDRFTMHFIGSLQTNKVKYIIDKVSMIESVDRFDLAKEINKQALKHDLVMDVLLEVNVGGEESKSGVEPDKALELAREIAALPGLRLRGVMTIPPICVDVEKQKEYFRRIVGIFNDISSAEIENTKMDYLSFGMSGDYEAAVSCGANIVRVGTGIFGARDYSKKN
ncbi:MAG: YggS family pyridoxal phosphate-dependent enzyme [Ruminococcaceae bacterium]|nr:YggS family pyridoxal phosphate-dependent enzyme [Oscillospiraceae bacterium]